MAAAAYRNSKGRWYALPVHSLILAARPRSSLPQMFARFQSQAMQISLFQETRLLAQDRCTVASITQETTLEHLKNLLTSALPETEEPESSSEAAFTCEVSVARPLPLSPPAAICLRNAAAPTVPLALHACVSAASITLLSHTVGDRTEAHHS